MRPGPFETTFTEQRLHNVQLDAETREDEFVEFRRKRDSDLAMPALMLPSIQMNVRAGEAPEPEGNGLSYLNMPLNAFEGRP